MALSSERLVVGFTRNMRNRAGKRTGKPDCEETLCSAGRTGTTSGHDALRLEGLVALTLRPAGHRRPPGAAPRGPLRGLRPVPVGLPHLRRGADARGPARPLAAG